MKKDSFPKQQACQRRLPRILRFFFLIFVLLIEPEDNIFVFFFFISHCRRGPTGPKRNPLLAYLKETGSKTEVAVKLPQQPASSPELNSKEIHNDQITPEEISLKDANLEKPKTDDIDLPTISPDLNLSLLAECSFTGVKPPRSEDLPLETDLPSSEGPGCGEVRFASDKSISQEEECLNAVKSPVEIPVPMEAAPSSTQDLTCSDTEVSESRLSSLETELIEDQVPNLPCSDETLDKNLKELDSCIPGSEEHLETTSQSCAEGFNQISVDEARSSSSFQLHYDEDAYLSDESSLSCIEFEPVEIGEEEHFDPQESVNSPLNQVNSCMPDNEEELMESPTHNRMEEASISCQAQNSTHSYVDESSRCSNDSSFSYLEFEPVEIHEDTSNLETSLPKIQSNSPELKPAEVPNQTPDLPCRQAATVIPANILKIKSLVFDETASKIVLNDSTNLLLQILKQEKNITLASTAAHPAVSAFSTDHNKVLECNNRRSSNRIQYSKASSSCSFDDTSSSSRASRCSQSNTPQRNVNTPLDGSFRQLRSQGQIQENHSMSLRRRSKVNADPKNVAENKGSKSQGSNQQVSIAKNRSSSKTNEQVKSSFRATAHFKSSQTSSNRGIGMKTRKGQQSSSVVSKERRNSSVIKNNLKECDQRQLACEFCGKKMETSRKLREHLKAQHKNQVKCKICKKSFGE